MTVPRGKPGRPLKFNAEVMDVICKGVRLGLSYERAAESAGLGRTALSRWMAAEAEGDLRFRGVSDALAKARAEGETRLIARVIKAGEEDWRAAAWILERRHPEHYARMERREVSGPDGGPLRVEVSSWVDLVRQATAAESAPAREVEPATELAPARLGNHSPRAKVRRKR